MIIDGKHVNGCVREPVRTDRSRFDSNKVSRFAVADSTIEHIIPEYTPISNQGEFPSCVSTSALDAYEILLGLVDPAKVVQLSRSALWWMIRHREGTENQIIGVRLSNAFDVLMEIGACPESMWPYDPPPGVLPSDWHCMKPKLAAREAMADNKLLGWAPIIDMGDQALLNSVDVAILANHPVIYGTAINTSFVYHSGDGVLMPPDSDDQIVGRHAIVIVGRRWRYNRREYLIRNSWGMWGSGGHAWVDERYITWTQATNHTVATQSVDIIC